jgi:proteasome lid subunit RPN8/RPN11
VPKEKEFKKVFMIIDRDALEQIIRHCQGEYPKEACGILAGKISPQSIVHSPQSIVYSPRPIVDSQQSTDHSPQSKIVSKVYKMTNASESPETCYFMKPEQQLKVFKEMRQLGIEMLGIYHSHPSGPTYPSQKDVEMAFYPEVDYVIVSLKDFNNPEIRAFKITEGKIEESINQGIDEMEEKQKII